MHSELHGNVVHHGVELLLLVSMLFLLAIPKFLLILQECLYTSKLTDDQSQAMQQLYKCSFLALKPSIVLLIMIIPTQD